MASGADAPAPVPPHPRRAWHRSPAPGGPGFVGDLPQGPLEPPLAGDGAGFEAVEMFAALGLGLFTLIKTAASQGPGAYLAVGSVFNLLLWIVMLLPLGDAARRRRWARALVLVGLLSMATSHNECLLLAMPTLPVVALLLGLRAAAGSALVLVVGTAVISLAHGDPPTDFVQWVASAAGGVLFLLAFSRVLLRERAGQAALRREVEVSAALSAAAERHRIAADLHDGLGHHLSAALIQVEAARAVGGDGGPAGPFLARASDLMRGAMDEVRAALQLHGAPRRGGGLMVGLDELIRTSADAGLPVELRGPGDGPPAPPPPLRPEAELALWRGAQEALTNARRHAEARRVTLRLGPEDGGFGLRVADDGRGLRGAPEGQGLRGMRERLQAVGGHARVGPGPEGGVEVRLWVPS